MSLANKQVVVGIAGGIAAFKAVELVRELQRRGAKVRVALTQTAAHFVGPVTFTGLTGTPPVIDIWDANYAGEVHVELAAWAHVIVVAPATANLLARSAAGMADDAVLATLRCFDGPVLYAPAMHHRMWRSPATQRAVANLNADGASFVGPVHGKLASGEEGMGRMSEPLAIADATEALFSTQRRDLLGLHVLITAGPTVEDLDPVRYLSNRSSGRMGYAIAERAALRGARVTLVSGPVQIAPPAGCELVSIRSARELQHAVQERRADVDAIIATAAVADYRPVSAAEHKLKKSDRMTLELVKNPDILEELGHTRTGARPVLVGFKLETQNLLGYAREMLVKKRVDLVVANEARDGLGGDDNVATLVDAKSDTALGKLSKRELADRILDRVFSLATHG
ncbi:MAG TPA: bifunctional phosphopantothenoylcysteine decarboxylase/phosphopantothenate--cysteine ligase CoaBC [Polyangiales bacterium]|nr:bifunctional phosphopantothenoylcysteine decarboxylase/phosphopantothenate--cysteine ligase CoaBC [Polyangiales bacterium]